MTVSVYRVCRKANGWYVVNGKGWEIEGPFWTEAGAENARRRLEGKSTVKIP